MDWRFENTYDSFTLEIGEALVSRGILFDDVTEAIYLVKHRPSDTDEDAVVSLTIGSGITKVTGAAESDAELAVNFSLSDFDTEGLRPNKEYYVGLGIRTASMVRYLEIGLEDNKLKILPDFIRN